MKAPAMVTTLSTTVKKTSAQVAHFNAFAWRFA